MEAETSGRETLPEVFRWQRPDPITAMSTESPESPTPVQSWIQQMRNWVSLSGLVTVLASLFAFLLLFLLDTIARSSNPYVGVLTYLVAPAFSTIGVGLVLLGMVLQRRKLVRARGRPVRLVIDLSQRRDRRILGFFVAGSVAFLFITAIGSYHSYQFTESVTFCGRTCHTVMKPEAVRYEHSPHARVTCAECHIGPGAQWFVKAKISGLHQVYASAFDTFPRPVPTPIKNLRPAQDTCEHCHWPQRFSGDMVRTYRHYLSDATNTEYTVRMMLRVGGSDPRRGPVSGIHWHTSQENKVEYLATDNLRLKIPWVRLTDGQGVVTEFRSPGFTNAVEPAAIRTMDCIDCHNRPSHRYEKPNEAVDLAIALGRISPALTSIRSNATVVLTQPYATEAEALQKIASTLDGLYPGDPRIKPAVEAVQQIYLNNFFPEMKASWKDYPEHIGHKDWPGCARCHDDQHKSSAGQRTIGFRDCNSCHVLVAQGQGAALDQLTPSGQEFKHPGEDYDPEFKCYDCHTGGP